MLKLDDVHVHYGRVHVLRGVSLEVPDGAVVALLGANGAGKTTTLKTISGILKPSRGSVHFDGEDISRLDAADIVRRGIIHCPEGRQVFPQLSVRENLMLGSYARGNGRVQFERVLDIFPALRPRLTQLAGTLSGGEQQMLAIGRALMGEPKLLLLDEPSLGLAPLIVEYIFQVIAKFREHDISVLLIEQNAMLALEFAGWAYALSHGQITFSHAAETLRDTDLVRRAYLA
ncbi:MAG TPA: ABC transporter ATP-binding protein [Casimicrobiaceae bacterium]|nr:ABC transporter ATP-binding protein [Casimicrobiaceae bacterium]